MTLPYFVFFRFVADIERFLPITFVAANLVHCLLNNVS